MRTIIFLSIAVLTAATALSQKVKDEEITFSYMRLPSNPIDKSINSYVGKVYLAYVDEDKKKMEEYEKQKAASDAKYTEEKKMADDKYAKDKQEYKNKSASDKFFEKVVLNENNQPQKEYVAKEQVQKPYTRKVADETLLASSYIKLEGYAKAGNAKLIVTFIIHGMERMEPRVQEGSKTSTSGPGAGQPQKIYTMEIKYRCPVSVKVETTDGTSVLNEVVEKTNMYKTWQSGSYNSESQLNSSVNPDNAVAQFEDKLLEENLKLANGFLNEKCAASTVKREIKLYNVESKKGDYNDFNDAFIAASEGYAVLAVEKENAVHKLQAAIALWDKALKESNPKDKKARINEEVTIALVLNLAEAYLWCDDFSKAKLTSTRATTLDLSKKEKNTMEELKLLIDDQKQRFEANQNR